MVAVKEISWEEASAPGFETTTRQVWRAAVGKPLLHPQDSHILAIATDSAGSLPPESSRRLQVMGLEDYDAIATFVSQHARRLAVAD